MHEKRITSLVTEVTVGFTLIPCRGYWKGLAEESIIIEIISPPCDNDSALSQQDISALAERIRIANNQEAVLWTVGAVDAGLEPGECS